MYCGILAHLGYDIVSLHHNSFTIVLLWQWTSLPKIALVIDDVEPFCSPIGLKLLIKIKEEEEEKEEDIIKEKVAVPLFSLIKTEMRLLLLLLSCRVTAAGKITFKSDCRSVWVLLGVCCSVTGDPVHSEKTKAWKLFSPQVCVRTHLHHTDMRPTTRTPATNQQVL